MNHSTPVIIFWFRRDLRLDDNHGLFKALQSNYPVLPIFIFDTEILDKLPESDARVGFIYNTLKRINKTLNKRYKSGISLFYGKPLNVFNTLITNYNVKGVFTNHDYEPYALLRDTGVKNFLLSQHIPFKTFKDHVVFEKSEVTKSNGSPYVVYTPYMKQWNTLLEKSPLEHYHSETLLERLVQLPNLPTLSLADIGFKHSKESIATYTTTSELIAHYKTYRDYPAKAATSRLGPHLRFGTVSIRSMIKKARNSTDNTFLRELIWRDFFIQILWHFPHTVTQSFKPKYDNIKWRNNTNEFKLWCDGKTGYPLVDAGMRELNQTGFMHNRVRMLVGSFLCKHLLIDWRWGEAYFAQKLHDYELASNVGNWQWVAGCGVDAAPYFRIFNPTTQIQKFDKNHDYIKNWAPEYLELTYPQPIVEHKFARERCLSVYKAALQ